MASRSLCHATLLCIIPEQNMPQMSPWGHQASGQAHDISPQKTDHHWKSIPDPNQWVGTTRASYRPSPQPSFCKEDRKWGIQGLPLPETEAPGVSSGFNQFWPLPPGLDMLLPSSMGNGGAAVSITPQILSLFQYYTLVLPVPLPITSDRMTSFQKSNCLCLLPTPPT